MVCPAFPGSAGGVAQVGQVTRHITEPARRAERALRLDERHDAVYRACRARRASLPAGGVKALASVAAMIDPGRKT